MPTTISVSPNQDNNPDLDGGLATGIESLRQRIEQALLHRFGTWFLRRDRGLNYNLLLGHQGTGLASTLILATVREEGGSEILAIDELTFDHDRYNRIFQFFLQLDTIYGTLSISQNIG